MHYMFVFTDIYQGLKSSMRSIQFNGIQIQIKISHFLMTWGDQLFGYILEQNKNLSINRTIELESGVLS